MAEVGAARLGLGTHAEVRYEEARKAEDERRPGGQYQWDVGAAQGEQRGASRGEQEPDQAEGDLLGQVALRAPPEHG